MKLLLRVLLCLMGFAVASESSLVAQTSADDALPTTNSASAASPEDLAKAIAQKEAEIDELKKQLSEAKSQINSLHDQNVKLQTSDQTLKTQVMSNPVAAEALRPAPAPLAATPDAAAPIDSSDLFWYFHNSADLANQYLSGKRIAVNGRLIGFEMPLFRRVFGIELASGDPNLRVVCKFDIPQIYNTVVFHRQLGTIVGQTAGGREDVLLNMNSSITLNGKCDGSDNGDVSLSRCTLQLPQKTAGEVGP